MCRISFFHLCINFVQSGKVLCLFPFAMFQPMRPPGSAAASNTASGSGSSKSWQNNNNQQVPQGQRLVTGVMQGKWDILQIIIREALWCSG